LIPRLAVTHAERRFRNYSSTLRSVTEQVPEVVTVHVWRVPRRHVVTAFARMATDRRPVRRAPGALFAKLLGTGDARFTPAGADPRRWALLVSWSGAADAAAFERSAVVRRWERTAEETCRLVLRPLAARGRWSRREPFGRPERAPVRWDGPVAAVTRARLAPLWAVRFWRAVPAVADALRTSAGLRLALGVGEAPVGLQGTFSVWESAAALRAFAYGDTAHAEVVRRTPAARWYAEELFARFAVVDCSGTVDGRAVLA
jgi:hypothetical protein